MEEIFDKPDKPFLLLSKSVDWLYDVVFWFDTQEELVWMARNNAAIHPYGAYEISGMRSVEF